MFSPPASIPPSGRRDKNSSSEEYYVDSKGPMRDGRRPGTPRFTPMGLDEEEYRVGGKHLPLLPIIFEPTAIEVVELFNSKSRASLQNVLDTHSIPSTVQIITIKSTGHPATKALPYAYAQCTWDPTNHDTWVKAADEMFSILSHEYNRLKVLIADERAMVSPVSRVIAVDDSLIPGWMDIADKVYKALLPNRDWLSIDLYHRVRSWGSGQESSRPTICVTIRGDSEEDWGDAIDGINQAIADEQEYKKRNVVLEILRTCPENPSFSTSP